MVDISVILRANNQRRCDLMFWVSRRAASLYDNERKSMLESVLINKDFQSFFICLVLVLPTNQRPGLKFELTNTERFYQSRPWTKMRDILSTFSNAFSGMRVFGWFRFNGTDERPLPELMHICITRPQYVKKRRGLQQEHRSILRYRNNNQVWNDRIGKILYRGPSQ